MTEQEMRELDAWLAEHVFEMRRVESATFFCWPSPSMMQQIKEAMPDVAAVDYFPIPHFCTNPADAMTVLKKCATAPVLIWHRGDAGFSVTQVAARRIYVEAATLELAICKFAKALYTK